MTYFPSPCGRVDTVGSKAHSVSLAKLFLVSVFKTILLFLVYSVDITGEVKQQTNLPGLTLTFGRVFQLTLLSSFSLWIEMTLNHY